MLKKLAVVGALSLIALPVVSPVLTPEASPALFENLYGKWRGKGLVKATPKGKKESIRCRMTNKPASEGGKVDLGGRCSVSGFVFSLNGYIKQNGSKNSYTASMFRSLANLKQSNFSGKRSGSRINFSFKARDRVSKQDIIATILLHSKNGKAFDIQISRTDPETGNVFKVGTIKFSKKG